jgi:dienelactone hydrolase
MTLEDLKATLKSPAPPDGIPQAVIALWHDARGNWDKAHRVAQDIGDAGNAEYWYRRAERPVARMSIEEEWDQIVTALLER